MHDRVCHLKFHINFPINGNSIYPMYVRGFWYLFHSLLGVSFYTRNGIFSKYQFWYFLMFEEITPHSWACQMMLCQKTLQQSLPAFDEKSDVGSYRRKTPQDFLYIFFSGRKWFAFFPPKQTHTQNLPFGKSTIGSFQANQRGPSIQSHATIVLPQAKLLLLLQRIHTIICYEMSVPIALEGHISRVCICCTLQSDKKP